MPQHKPVPKSLFMADSTPTAIHIPVFIPVVTPVFTSITAPSAPTMNTDRELHMIKLLVALALLFAGVLALSFMPTHAVAYDVQTVQPAPAVLPSLDTTMPAPQEPLDTTVITPVESAGAAHAG